MRPSPLLTAVGASAGTFVVLGGTTAIVSGVALSVAKRVVRARRNAAATSCAQCTGSGFLPCQICMGHGVLRCRAPVRRSQLARKLRPQAEAAAAPPVQCSCPGCGTTRLQRCLNCLGEGRVCLPS
ncbi:hypothetical protein C2E21_5308 [Chlorella sorokiniana]|uniref:Uncharacterized protein n=1 Tax=Chlorella sorokiniana TaxID=3076 RepID=A0A2P6TQS5_CHLSO|nr:hypothetical protein C2E21_5308 [Chlorella sorokiniana]|eukprot:PRW56352.1 hypothetical protein C2E21_5308 [Chlorella sorokiniana]